MLETDASHDAIHELCLARYRTERVELLHMPAVVYLSIDVTTTFPSYSNEDIAQLQKEDSAIGTVHKFTSLGRKPNSAECKCIPHEDVKWLRLLPKNCCFAT